MGQVKKIIISFIISHLGLSIAIYAVFKKAETLFLFGALVDYFFRMWFIWILSLPPGAETGEERGIRFFSFTLVAIILALVTIVIAFLLNRFYF